MEYMVLASDGNEYGPVGSDKLKQWANEGRVHPHTELRNFQTGQTLVASTVEGLFDSKQQEPLPYSDPRLSQDYASQTSSNPSDKGVLIGVTVRAVLAVVLFFVFHGLGLIVAGFAMFYAVQAKSAGNRHGTVALVIASLALAAVGIGWLLRLQGAKV